MRDVRTGGERTLSGPRIVLASRRRHGAAAVIARYIRELAGLGESASPAVAA